MSAFSRTHDDATWTAPGYVTVPSDWADLSSKVARSLNGDRGGTWSPSSLLDFAAGNVTVNGQALVAYGGTLKGLDAGTFVLNGASEWPVFAPGHALRKRSILHSMLPRVSKVRGNWVTDLATMSVRSIALGLQTTDRTSVTGPTPLRLVLRTHDGGTLKRAVFTFRVPTLRTTSPVRMPRFRVLRIDAQGNRKALTSTAAGADANGWLSPALVTSAASWWNSGKAQTFTLPCDQFNVIDKSNFTYWAEIQEEGGATVGSPMPDGFLLREKKLDVDLAIVGAVSGALSGSKLIDGINTTAGMRVLIHQEPTATAYQQGVWVASAGAWTRALDFDAVPDITTNCIVYVKSGSLNKGRSFQVISPLPAQIGASAATGDGIFFGPLEPSGNAYHSLRLEFEDIPDMRWQ